MLHSFKLLQILALAGILLLLSAFVSGPTGVPASPLQIALVSTEKQLRRDMEGFNTSISDYLATVADKASTPEAIRSRHRSCRRAYKRIEYLLAYAQPATITRHINGAPLPKTEQGAPEIVVIDPCGLQTLDELAFEETPDRSAMMELLKKLRGDYRILYAQMKGLLLQHRHVFEAMQEQTVRIFTLGLTGFDTPSSGEALPEAWVNFQVLQATFSNYKELVYQQSPAVADSIDTAINMGLRQLAEGEFESFDRLTFLTEVINPLTKNLPKAQQLLAIESASDFTGLPKPVAHGPTTLFAPDFLDAAYFANVDQAAKPEARRALGELLFFDVVLSKDLSLSCASCHQPGLAFSDGYTKSLGGDGVTVLNRNSPSLINSVFSEKYFYDLRESFLERQVKHVVRDAHEFNTDFIEIERRLRLSDEYVALFAEAYQDQPRYQLSRWSISDALGRYVMSLTALDSKFDRFARGDTAILAASVRRGFNLFMGKAACGTCHFAPTFNGLVPPYYTESESEVLGVPQTSVWENASLDTDPGRVANARPNDEVYFNQFAFKTPTVRNASVTAPYMHNGVYADLEAVLKFYNLGGGAGIGIELEHQTLPTAKLGLSPTEIADIIDFMESLEDYQSLAKIPEKLPSFSGLPSWNTRKILER